MNFRSVADLSQDLRNSIHVLPDDIVLVVGVPRSGMLAASILALHLNVPLTDFEGFAAGRVFSGGKTRKTKQSGYPVHGTVLIVDDSSSTGAAMAQVADTVAHLPPTQLTIKTVVVYGTSKEMTNVDFVLKVLPLPRIFEWNVFHHPIIETSQLDIDGVLCLDPSNYENDDSENYIAFLQQAPRMMRPTYEAGALVTSRLEKYRFFTERWLSDQGIKHKELIMLDLPDAAARREADAHATHKANAYAASSAILFIESEYQQAVEISRISGKPVLSIEGMIMVHPGLSSVRAVLWQSKRKIANMPFLRKILGPRGRFFLKKLFFRA